MVDVVTHGQDAFGLVGTGDPGSLIGRLTQQCAKPSPTRWFSSSKSSLARKMLASRNHRLTARAEMT